MNSPSRLESQIINSGVITTWKSWNFFIYITIIIIIIIGCILFALYWKK